LLSAFNTINAPPGFSRNSILHHTPSGSQGRTEYYRIDIADKIWEQGRVIEYAEAAIFSLGTDVL